MSINLTTVFQLMPYAQNIAHAELVQPLAQQQAAAMQAQEMLKKEQGQVQKVQEQTGAEEIKDEKEQKRQAGAQDQRGRSKSSEEPEAETDEGGAMPWMGNIVNRRI